MYDRLQTIAIVPMLLTTIVIAGCISPHLPIRTIVTAEDEPYSIILMIGDGMALSHVELGRLVEYGAIGNHTMQQVPLQLSVTTYSANGAITDSAAAATAMATGEKTNNGMVSVLPNGTSIETILEIAQAQGKATGVVVTSTIQHATPAAFMTHIDSRNNYTEITRQIVEEAEVDVLLGGGLTYFSSSQLQTMENQNYTVVNNRTELLKVASGKLLGLFADGHMDYERNRNYSTTPSLAEMANKSIEILSQDSDGFFLMIEGSRIDHAAHGNDKVGVALEMIAFDQAVSVALDYIQTHHNTILIVTADHETGGLAIVSNILSDELPSSLVDEGEKRTLRVARAENITVTWSTNGHTNTNVPLFSFGEIFDGYSNGTIIDNIDIFDEMKEYYSSEPTSPVPEPTTTTTEETTVDDISSTATEAPCSSTNETDAPAIPYDVPLLTLGLGSFLVVLAVLFLALYRKNSISSKIRTMNNRSFFRTP